MTSLKPLDAWAAILGSLQVEVTRHNYETWLRNTSGLKWDGANLVVGVPSPFVAEFLEKRMEPLIRKAASEVLKRSISVSYVVQPLNSTIDKNATLDTDSMKPNRETLSEEPYVQPGSGLNPRWTFDTFIVGKSNRFAHAAAMAVSESPGTAYNPLFIHSGVGLGKTHLLHAIGHSVSKRGLTYVYASAERFTNDFVAALRDGRVEEFRAKYRDIDVLLIDDIQFIAGKEHSRESFFHTFNDLHDSGRQIVLSSDSRPKSIPLLEERLRSRFEGGLMADINIPDLETRMAIVQTKAIQASVLVGEDVVDFLARKFVHNVRELEGGLNRVLAMSFMTKRPIDFNLAAQAISDPSPEKTRRPKATPAAIIEAVSSHYGLSNEDLEAKTRKKEISVPRQVAAYLLREETSRSLSDIGKLLGNRGHTTILRAHGKIAYDLNLNSDLRRQVTEIRHSINDSSPKQT